MREHMLRCLKICSFFVCGGEYFWGEGENVFFFLGGGGVVLEGKELFDLYALGSISSFFF